MTPEYRVPGDWLDPKTVLVDLLAEVPWVAVTPARSECFMAPERLAYTYGEGVYARTYASTTYHPDVQTIQDRLNAEGNAYNVCFLNRYDNHRQQLGWHADDSPGMLHEHPIAVVSFGAEREIWWRKVGHKGVIPVEQRQPLAPGSLFVMPPGFQREYQHRIPKASYACNVRISLTFRRYVP